MCASEKDREMGGGFSGSSRSTNQVQVKGSEKRRRLDLDRHSSQKVNCGNCFNLSLTVQLMRISVRVYSRLSTVSAMQWPVDGDSYYDPFKISMLCTKVH